MSRMFGFERLSAALGRLQSAGENPVPALKRCREHILNDVARNFDTESGPDGAWTPLAPSTVASRRHGGGSGRAKILQDKGELAGSITGKITAIGHSASLEVGTNVPHAKFHQDADENGVARTKIPERVFVGFDDDLIDACVGELENSIEEALA